MLHIVFKFNTNILHDIKSFCIYCMCTCGLSALNRRPLEKGTNVLGERKTLTPCLLQDLFAKLRRKTQDNWSIFVRGSRVNTIQMRTDSSPTLHSANQGNSERATMRKS